ncbi:MAG: hypothetical protein HKO13_10785 [Sphingomonas sp.]|nr:hypothetical protein [Sphingomonas sp.]
MRQGQLGRNTDGAVAPLVALLTFLLVASAGIAFDYSRIAGLDTEMQNAADQAALAAATQLDQLGGAQARGTAAAEALVNNLTFFGNDGNADGTDITITEVVFYATEQAAVADNTTDNEACPVTDLAGTSTVDDDIAAEFVCVRTVARTANFALTPVVSALSGDASAMAVASIGAAICRVPPMMICNPSSPNPPPDDIITDAYIGVGFRVTGHGNTKLCTGQGNSQVTDPETGELVDCSQNVSAWSPGGFGFLEVGSGHNHDLIRALAFDFVDFECLTDEGQDVSTGNPQALYDAINTRFDIYDFNANNGNGGNNNGNILSNCGTTGVCPAAANTVKDVINPNPPSSVPASGPNSNVGGNRCKFKNSAGAGGQGWRLPSVQYTPDNYDVVNPALASNPVAPTHDAAVGSLSVMGYPRDLCHYNSYNSHSAGGADTNCGSLYPLKVGNGNWGRGDYFSLYHSGITPPNDITRFQTYRWELGETIVTPGGSTLMGTGDTSRLPGSSGGQRSSPVCNAATSDLDRRVLTVAIVNNCSSLSGSSTPVIIGEYVDMFLVEPIIDGGQNNSRGNGDVKDSIYMELIGPAGTGNRGAQTVQRRVPFLIK